MRKIVILTGSPRENGNTMTLVKAFSEVAKKRGDTVKIHNTAKTSIGGCRACNGCQKKGDGLCIFDDGFNEIAVDIIAADIVVLATPVYFYDFSAQLKAVIDRCYAFLWAPEKLANKKSALIAVAGDENLSVFDITVKVYEGYYSSFGWNNIGEILVPGATEIGDVERTDGIERVRALAQKI